MRITAISTENVIPVRKFAVEGLSDVVVLAGANGVGKTRLLNWLVQFFRNLRGDPNSWIIVEATSAEESREWGQRQLDTRNPNDSEKLRQLVQRNRKRSAQKSSVLLFESDRTISQVQPFQFTWDFSDPDDEEVGWDFGFQFLKNRFTDTQNSIFRKVRSRREKIAQAVERLVKLQQGENNAASEQLHEVKFDFSNFPDPIVPFREAFSLLLSPKELVDPDPKDQTLQFRDENGVYPISSLSSGEREVVNIVFDFLLRNPKDCVVIFDEPELHLHPELSYKMIQTLRAVGERNQFIFCTHSAEIISSSIENSVVFVSPTGDATGNQAVLVREDDETNEALNLIGQSIGIVSLGRKIVLIEGEHSSLDKQTYGAIIRNSYPSLVLVPSGGRDSISATASALNNVLGKTIWGVDFFMLCDRDSSPIETSNAFDGRFRVLPRYHLENYFLEPTNICRVFADQVDPESWLQDPMQIDNKLRSIARSQISYTVALAASRSLRLDAGNVSLMPRGAHGLDMSDLQSLFEDRAAEERQRLSSAIDVGRVRETVARFWEEIEAGFESGEWRSTIPGRQVIKRFCSEAQMDFGRFKLSYIKNAMRSDQTIFSDIHDILRDFMER